MTLLQGHIPYSTALNWRLSFALLRASIMSIRGARSSQHHPATECPIDPSACRRPSQLTLYQLSTVYMYSSYFFWFLAIDREYACHYGSKGNNKECRREYFVLRHNCCNRIQRQRLQRGLKSNLRAEQFVKQFQDGEEGWRGGACSHCNMTTHFKFAFYGPVEWCWWVSLMTYL